jgi:hypothetical protein
MLDFYRSRQFGRTSAPTVPHFVQTMRDPKRWHTHLTGPPIRVEDRLVVAGEARYGERAHAVGAHVPSVIGSMKAPGAGQLKVRASM